MKTFIPVLLGALLLPFATFAAETAATVVVVAKGVGDTVKSAERAAFRAAVEKVVGTLVDAETLVANDEIVEDSILAYSNGFVETFETVKGPSKHADGLYSVTIRATVRKGQLAEKVTAAFKTEAAVDGDGPHAVRFLFWNSGDAAGDHAAMDQVSWSGAATKETTQATPAEVPFAWLSGHGLGTDGNWDGAAFAPAANGIDDVWQCYVSGIDPTDPAARFIAAIEMVEGEPDIRPLPDLGTNRVYVVQGKDVLEEYDWGPTNAASRFFRIKVAIPK